MGYLAHVDEYEKSFEAALAPQGGTIPLRKISLTLTKSFVIMPLMAPQSIPPTKLELEVLTALWRKGPGTVREIHAAVNDSRPCGHTTVLKMLQIMTEKGLVLRDDTARPQIYRVKHSQEQTRSRLVKDLIQRAFDGSVKALVMQALSTKKTSDRDMETITKLLDKFEGDPQ